MFARIALTIVLLLGGSLFGGIFDSASLLISGKMAGVQLDSSDTAFIANQAIQHVIGGFSWIMPIAVFAGLIMIWWGPVKRLFSSGIVPTITLGVLLLLGAGVPHPAYAYFDTTDKTEAYTVLPNESAFWIPDVGDNKTSQNKMDSEAYYEAAKIPVKRVVIPHTKLSGSGGWGAWDSYVPTGRLIIVDRTPQSREWIASTTKGTSSQDESFPCQSKEGLNIRVGISIGVEVHEESAAKYLYHFGVLPPSYIAQDGHRYLSDRTAPATIFTSVYYGRSLADVTDDVVRKKVQTLVCNEIAGRTFKDANDQQVQIMASVEKSATAYLSDYGITLDFIGYGDTWEFDHDVQKAIDDSYIAASLAPNMDTLQKLNNIRVQEGLAKGLENHGLPVVIPEGLLQAVEGLATHLSGGAGAK